MIDEVSQFSGASRSDDVTVVALRGTEATCSAVNQREAIALLSLIVAC